MFVLPEPLAPLREYAQFILYKLVPGKIPGKMDKLPVDPVSCQVFRKGDNWQQKPDMWTTDRRAAQRAYDLGPDYGVGFFFTPDDPFFFVDIDNCLYGGKWSPVAMDLMTRLQGAAVEVSQSGTGLHIFGKYQGGVPDHAKKNKDLNIELYTSGRFVALTGINAIGSAGVDCTDRLRDLVPVYYPPKQAAEGAPIGWTTEPVPEYTGPEDDDELIRRATTARSVSSAFGGTASFKELWEADEDALESAYPDERGRAYDASSADQALAQHLAFWTGNNCERMLRIMRLSDLVRDKWEREDYLHRTILNAVSMQKTVYSVVKDDTADTGTTGLKGTAGQIDFAVKIRAQKLLENPELTDEINAITSARFWLDNKDRSAVDIVASVKRFEGAPVAMSTMDEPEIVSGYQFLGASQQVEYFQGCVYIQDVHRVFVPSGSLLKSDQFNATYGGYVFGIDDSGAKTTKKAFEAFTESQLVRYPKAETSCFRPMLKPGELLEQDGRVMVNTYVPFSTRRVKGDPGPFLRHLQKILPDQTDQTILLSYMAACVQYTGVKFQWAPLIQGVEGNGKTFFTRCVAAAIGDKYVHMPPASEIGEKFNAWLFNKLFIGVEDVYVPEQRREIIEILKPMITNTRLARRAMQQDQVMHDVCCNFIFNSNHKDAIRKTENDRRFAVFYTAQQHAGDICRDGLSGDYFPNLYDWFNADGAAVVTEFLHSYVIVDAYNPATECHRAPRTSTTDQAIAASLGGIEQEIMEAIDEDRPGFAGGWVSSMALEMLLRNKRKDGAIPLNKRRDVLKLLGYEYHPGLSQGRVNNVVSPDGGKPRLFIKIGHPARALTVAADIARAYSTAQNLTAANAAKEAFGNE